MSHLSPAAHRRPAQWLRAVKAAVRQVDRATQPTRVRWLSRHLTVRNRWSRRPVTGAATAPVVSMTSYGTRTRSCWLTVESIARGARRPSRLILWLDDASVVADPPPELVRLRRRGLEILATPDLGPHKKYYPAVEDPGVCAGRPLVTADDDVLYPRRWLRSLADAAAATPGHVIGFRARTIAVEGTGIAPYATWRHCRSDRPGPRVFVTGVSGALYPAVMQRALREEGRGFLTQAPRADDIWLHATALRHGVPVRQVGARPRHFLEIPGSQVQSLQDWNVAAHGNDRQVETTYTGDDLARIVGAAHRAT